MHTIGFPIKRYQGLLSITWKWTWRDIWIFFLPKEESRLTISHTWFCNIGLRIITNISRLNLAPRYWHYKLKIQIIQIVQGHLMGFIYALRLVYRAGGHQIMDLLTGKFITIPKVVQIPIKYVVINSVLKMALEQWFKSLECYNIIKNLPKP